MCVGGQTYVLGGSGSDETPQSVEYFDDKTGSWRRSVDMPIKLYNPTAVSYKHYIYVFSGLNTAGHVSSENLVFDTVNKTWDNKADMPQECSEASAVVYRDRIYALGEKYCMSYSPDQDWWETHTAPREDHDAGSAVVWKDRILLCGGKDTTVIEEYNPDTDTWTDWKHQLPQTYNRAMFAVSLY